MYMLYIIYGGVGFVKLFFLFDEFSGGEFDEIIVAVFGVGKTGEFEGGEIMAESEGEFADNERGVRSDDASAKEMTTMVGEEFDEAVAKIMDEAGGDVGKGGDGFVIFLFMFF